MFSFNVFYDFLFINLRFDPTLFHCCLLSWYLISFQHSNFVITNIFIIIIIIIIIAVILFQVIAVFVSWRRYRSRLDLIDSHSPKSHNRFTCLSFLSWQFNFNFVFIVRKFLILSLKFLNSPPRYPDSFIKCGSSFENFYFLFLFIHSLPFIFLSFYFLFPFIWCALPPCWTHGHFPVLIISIPARLSAYRSAFFQFLLSDATQITSSVFFLFL